MGEKLEASRGIGAGVLGAADSMCDAISTTQSTDPMRNQYRILSPYDADRVASVKAIGAAFLATIGGNMPGREASIARTKMEEAVMWAVKGITG